MKKKLKTWEQFESEFKPLVDEWNDGDSYIYIAYKNIHWHINLNMKKMFGTEIEVFKLNFGMDYTHHGNEKTGFAWHESWFEPEYKEIEFLSIEEVKI